MAVLYNLSASDKSHTGHIWTAGNIHVPYSRIVLFPSTTTKMEIGSGGVMVKPNIE